MTGFDDTPVAQAVGLTSVSQPLAQTAARCVDLLAGVLDGGPDDAPSQVLLRPRWCCAGPPDPTPTPPPPTIPMGKTK